MTVRALFVLGGLAACSSKPAPAPPAPPAPVEPAARPAGKVSVALASVTLADDCGLAPTTTPPALTAAPHAMRAATADNVAGGQAVGGYARPCVQSSVQLVIENTTAAAATLVVKSVAIIDAQGVVISQPATYQPSRWADDAYTTWDGVVGAGSTLNVAYSLVAPGVHVGETYTVRIVVEAGGGDTTVETKATTEVIEGPASLPAGAVT